MTELDDKIIRVEIVQGDIEHRVTLGEFVDMVVAETQAVSFTSRLFTTRGTVDPDELERAQRSAIDRVVQRIRDGRA